MSTQSSKFEKFLEIFDYSGKQMNLTYKGHQTFHSVIGGVMTILTRLAILSYVLYSLKDVITQKNTIINKNTYKDTSIDPTVVILNISNFDIGIYIQYGNNASNPDVLLHLDKYIDVSMQELRTTYDSSSGAFVYNYI